MLRESLLQTMQTLEELGLNRGTSGNASLRQNHGFLITPSGMTVKAMSTKDMAEMDMQGITLGARKPSSEWLFHRDIYQARPEIGAVIHTHSMFASTLSCLRQDIPPFHYMIAVTGSDTIRCADYALFGSQALSDAAINALRGSRACLLANHGMIAIGKTMQQALSIAIEVEALCEQYLRAIQIGHPKILSANQMAEVFEQFKNYGHWNQ